MGKLFASSVLLGSQLMVNWLWEGKAVDGRGEGATRRARRLVERQLVIG